ncbi:MAG TPA: GNAT family N-acetyltransferase, partial [Castellaniella sp.]|nr:GNAT family N-acetyltransferase [Castellaniella sp.]
PAWDPDFNTADFPILLDLEWLDDRYRRHFGM